MAKEKDTVSTDGVDNKQNEGKAQALRTVLASIEKQFGKGTVMKFSDDTALPEVEFISTGSVLLDKATGGGVPRGRIVEIYGPESSGKTSLCLSTIAQAQKMGLQCAFIDVENALDVVYAQKLGVNLNDLLISQPDYGEQALEITDSLIASNAVDLIIVDSVAALVPKAELEGDMGDSHMGLQARLMSQALRKITATAKRNNTTVIFINQIRMKIGVMFGCVHGETLLNFVDGRSIPMRDVVEKQITGKVWSWNEKLKEYEAKEITDWHHNSFVNKKEDYLHIQTKSINGGGRFGLTVTPDHKVMTESGWKRAKDVALSDKLQTKYVQQVNGTLADFLWGTFVGDSHLRIRDKGTASFRLQDGKNDEYVQWKLSKLNKFYNFKKATYGKEPLESGEFRVKYTSNSNAELAIIKNELGERDPEVFLNDHYSPLGLALWYMDDGCVDTANSHKRCNINVKRFSHEHTKLNDIAKAFHKATGILPSVTNSDGSLIFNKDNCEKLMGIIARYVPACMQYKLLPEYQGKYVEFELTNDEKIVPAYVPITEIRHASSRQMRMRDKYDITVKDNHNYLIGGINNGVIVHNSPETTAGGNALKFYASMRLDIRRIGAIKDKETNIGNQVRIKTVKNKVFPPFKEAEVDFLYEKGFNLVGEILDMAVDKGIVVKGGAWYSYNDAKLGQGRDNSCGFLTDNPAIFEEIKTKVLAK